MLHAKKTGAIPFLILILLFGDLQFNARGREMVFETRGFFSVCLVEIQLVGECPEIAFRFPDFARLHGPISHFHLLLWTELVTGLALGPRETRNCAATGGAGDLIWHRVIRIAGGGVSGYARVG